MINNEATDDGDNQNIALINNEATDNGDIVSKNPNLEIQTINEEKSADTTVAKVDETAHEYVNEIGQSCCEVSAEELTINDATNAGNSQINSITSTIIEDNIQQEERNFSNKETKKLNFMSAFLLVLAVSIPVTIGSIIMPLSHIIDSVLVVKIISEYYTGSAISLYGLFSGPVNSLISLPVVVAGGIAVAIIPYVSATRIKDGKASAKGKIELAIKLTFLIAFPCGLGMFIFANNIMSMLYPRLSNADLNIATNLLKISTLSILFLTLMQTAVSILVALKRAIVTTMNLVIAVLIKLLLNYLLLNVPAINIYGAAISAVSCYFVAAILNMLYIIKFTGLSLSFYKVLVKPILCAVITIAFAYAAYVLLNYFIRTDFSTVMAIILCLPVFAISIVKLNVFTDNELKLIPLLKRLKG